MAYGIAVRSGKTARNYHAALCLATTLHWLSTSLSNTAQSLSLHEHSCHALIAARLPGTDIGTLDQAYVPPAIQKTELRRRPLGERSAA